MHVTYERLVPPLHEHGSVRNAERFKQTPGRSDNRALGVGEANPRIAGELSVEVVEQAPGFCDVLRIAQGLHCTQHAEFLGAAVHVTIETVNHRGGVFRQLMPSLFLVPGNRGRADDTAEDTRDDQHRERDDDCKFRS